MSTDMDIINDPADNFDSAFERIETPTDHGTIHVRYRLTDAQWARLCAVREPDLPDFPDMSGMTPDNGELGELYAQSHGVTADSVFDLARMLRAPGTHNNKAQTNGQPGKLVRTLADCGGPLTVAEINERPNEFGIYENVNDRGVPGDSVCDPEHLDLHGWVVRLREDHDRRRGRPGGPYG